MVEIPMEGVLFLLSGIAIVHFDDMQKTYPFTYLPNKFQVAFLFVLSTILYLILFAGVVVDTVLDMTRESIIDFILS